MPCVSARYWSVASSACARRSVSPYPPGTRVGRATAWPSPRTAQVLPRSTTSQIHGQSGADNTGDPDRRPSLSQHEVRSRARQERAVGAEHGEEEAEEGEPPGLRLSRTDQRTGAGHLIGCPGGGSPAPPRMRPASTSCGGVACRAPAPVTGGTSLRQESQDPAAPPARSRPVPAIPGNSPQREVRNRSARCPAPTGSAEAEEVE